MSIDLSLDRPLHLLSHLPSYTRPTVHIAGTNGKGSVSAIVSSILSASEPPLKVGRFNSPHLVSVHDSIVLDNEPVLIELYNAVRAEVVQKDREHGTNASSFELLTITALMIFERTQVDVVVLEVGMGGRLDATNIVPDEYILISVLTSVDLDHQSFLGDTVGAIAAEKAAIARKGRPFVLGPQKHLAVEEVVKRVLAEKEAPLYPASKLKVRYRNWNDEIDGPRHAVSLRDCSPPPPGPISIQMPCFGGDVSALLPLFGEHQLENVGIAAAIISLLVNYPTSTPLKIGERISLKTVAKGISEVKWDGRLSFHEYVPPDCSWPLFVLVDGAHNYASSRTLSTYIKHFINMLPDKTSKFSVTYIVALSHSPPKTPIQTLAPLFPPALPEDTAVDFAYTVAPVTFTPPVGMPWVKCTPPSEIAEAVRILAPKAHVWNNDEVGNYDLRDVLDRASVSSDGSSDHLVVIAGSLYLVADFYRLEKFLKRKEGELTAAG